MTNNMTISFFLYCLSLSIVRFKINRLLDYLAEWLSFSDSKREQEGFNITEAHLPGLKGTAGLLAHGTPHNVWTAPQQSYVTSYTGDKWSPVDKQINTTMKSGKDTKQQRTCNLTSSYISH